MLNFTPSLRIYAALQPVDMRRSHHGLAAIVQEQLGLDPLSGHLVFFTNKQRNMAKILFFDRSGYAILFKRLERGTFQLPVVPAGATRVEVEAIELAMILEGIDLRSVVRRTRYRHERASSVNP